MATFTAETVTRTERRWIVPAAEPWGAGEQQTAAGTRQDGAQR